MTTTKLKARALGFFNTADSSTAKQPDFPPKIPAGHDCFHAVAVSLLAHYKRNTTPRTPWLHQLLTHHAHYFPQHQPASSHHMMGPKEHMQWLLTHIHLTELCSALAYTLRQIAVDEFCNNPKPYLALLAQQPLASFPLPLWHSSATPIGQEILLALANSLQLSIEVRYVEPEKNLPQRTRYTTNTTHPPQTPHLVLKRYQGKYYPMMPSGQTTIPTPPLCPIKPQPLKNTPSLSELPLQLMQEKQQVLNTFQKVHHQLTTMINAGELHLAELLTMYISSLNQQRIQYAGTEHGTTHWFDALIDSDFKTLRAPTQENHLTQALVHALARAISAQHMRAETVFNTLEQQGTQRTTFTT